MPSEDEAVRIEPFTLENSVELPTRLIPVVAISYGVVQNQRTRRSSCKFIVQKHFKVSDKCQICSRNPFKRDCKFQLVNFTLG